MEDEPRDVKVSTNGNGRLTTEPRHALGGLDDQSIDQRLGALRDTIHGWDWRTTVGKDATGRPVPEGTGTTEHGPTGTPGEAPAPPAPPALTADAAVSGVESAGGSADMAASAVGAPPAPPLASSAVVPFTPTADPEGASAAFPAESDPAPEGAKTHAGLWSRRSTRVVAALLALVVVAAIGWLVVGHTHSNGDSPTAVGGSTQLTTHTTASQSTTTTTSPSPLTATQMTQFDGYATALEKANATAASGLGGLSSPTVAQVTPLIAAYMTAANLYNLEIHTIQWPASMQADVQANYAQWSAFRGFLQSESAVTQPSMAAWLSQLHTVGAATEATDNKVRHDLGAAASSSFP